MDNLYTVTGTVVIGDEFGRKLGYPTANIDVEVDIPRGVYAGTVTRESTKKKKEYRAGIVIGAQNTYKPAKVEVHILDFEEDLYGETLTLNLKKFIRKIREYKDDNKLKKDIASDIEKIRNLNL